jgi:hypothetical protein
MKTWTLIGLLALGLAGCAEDRIPDPYDADPPVPPPTYDLATETGAAQALATMFAAGDTAGIRTILRPEATLQLGPGWPVSSLLARELRLSLTHLLGGGSVSVPGGGLLPGVDSLRVTRWDLDLPFHDAPVGSPYPGTREAGYLITLTAFAGGDTLLAPVTGSLLMYVRADTVGGAPVHRLAGLRDLTWVSGTPLSRFLVDYLANQPPAVAVSAQPASGPPGTSFHLDAGASRDPEGGPLVFRWRIGDSENPWTAWTAAAVVDTAFENPGPMQVAVAARDRWLLEGAGFTTITVVP